MRPPLALLLLAACVAAPDSGTAVGNPTGLTVDTAGGAAVALKSAEVSSARLVETSCAGVSRTVLVLEGPVDLLGGTRVDLDLTDVCGLGLEFDAPLTLSGEGPGGSSFTLSLAVDAVEIPLDGAAGPELAVVRLGAPGWISADTLGLTDGVTVEVAPGDPLHDPLVASLVDGTTLTEDTDGDGRCDDGCVPEDGDDTGDDDTGADDTGDDDSGDDTGDDDTGDDDTGDDDTGDDDTGPDDSSDDTGDDTGDDTSDDTGS